MVASVNDITGDSIFTRDSKKYREKFDEVFEKKDPDLCQHCGSSSYTKKFSSVITITCNVCGKDFGEQL